jgi:hypothetical protein
MQEEGRRGRNASCHSFGLLPSFAEMDSHSTILPLNRNIDNQDTNHIGCLLDDKGSDAR